MKKNRKWALVFGSVMMTVALVSGCSSGADQAQTQNDIIILYTSDVHCGIDENIGYAGLTSYKEWMLEKTPYVTLVDCGDAVQGEAVGIVSDGEYLVDLMNSVGYDLAVLGNHEFDYGMEQAGNLVEKSEAQYIGCNITYTGDGENELKDVAPYEIIEYGDVSVG